MASEDLTIRLGLKGQAQVARGLREVKGDAQGVGAAAESAGAKAVMMGAKFSQGTDRATIGLGKLTGALGLVAGARGLGRLTAAGVKWGLSFNAQVESARLRFGLFTDDVQGLTSAVQKIDMSSAFNFGDLSDAAALLGNQGVRNIPQVLQGIANAAAASGRGTQALNSIAIAIGQIQAKGRLSQEELNQILEAGGPGAQQAVQKAFNLTSKQLGNLGAQGLDAGKAIRAITAEWTSGRMAKAAEQQTKTLGGQWALLTGNMQKTAGAATAGLAHGLEKNVLPAANKATEEITRIFGQDGLSNEEKLRRAREVIKRDLGPVADDLKTEIDRANIPEHLGDVVGAAVPYMAGAAAKAAPHVAEAFVKGWLHSGPWAQLATLLFIAKKAGGGRGGLGGGGLGGALGKASPVPVFVTNWGGVPGSHGGTTMPVGVPGEKTPTTRRERLKGAGTGALAVLPFLPEAYEVGKSLGEGVNLHDPAYAVTHALLSRLGPLAPGNRPSAPQDPISRSLKTGDLVTVQNNLTVTLDGRVVGYGVARSNAKQKARK